MQKGKLVINLKIYALTLPCYCCGTAVSLLQQQLLLLLVLYGRSVTSAANVKSVTPAESFPAARPECFNQQVQDPDIPGYQISVFLPMNLDNARVQLSFHLPLSSQQKFVVLKFALPRERHLTPETPPSCYLSAKFELFNSSCGALASKVRHRPASATTSPCLTT